MTDAHLVHPWYMLVEIVEVDETEVVTGIQSQTYFSCCHGGLHEWLYSLFPVSKIARGIWLGIEFHAVGATLLGGSHHLGVWIDEDRRAYSRFLRPSHHIGEESLALLGVVSVV